MWGWAQGARRRAWAVLAPPALARQLQLPKFCDLWGAGSSYFFWLLLLRSVFGAWDCGAGRGARSACGERARSAKLLLTVECARSK